jgi:CBS domain-containing protein
MSSFKTMRAHELMTRNVLTIAPTADLRAAARIMHEHHVHCLVVPAADPARSAGVITTKDIVQVLCASEPEALEQLRVEDVMTTPALGLQQDFLVHDCIKLMRMSGVRSAPVLDGTRVVGLLSFTDVLRLVAGPELP